MTLTYLGFLALFVVPPVAVLAATRRQPTRGGSIVVIALVGLAYTTPWDNYLVGQGVWRYGDGVVRASVWLAPVGEYLFVLLQVALTGLWVARVATDPPPRLGATAVQRVAGLAAGGAVGGAGLLLVGRGPTYYLGAILLWAGPVLALQWAVGWPALWRRRRTVLVAVAVPTVYLCAVDRVALALGLWRLSPEHTTGVALLGLPVEEATFFLVTNAFVVQGLLLYGWVVERWR